MIGKAYIHNLFKTGEITEEEGLVLELKLLNVMVDDVFADVIIEGYLKNNQVSIYLKENETDIFLASIKQEGKTLEIVELNDSTSILRYSYPSEWIRNIEFLVNYLIKMGMNHYFAYNQNLVNTINRMNLYFTDYVTKEYTTIIFYLTNKDSLFYVSSQEKMNIVLTFEAKLNDFYKLHYDADSEEVTMKKVVVGFKTTMLDRILKEEQQSFLKENIQLSLLKHLEGQMEYEIEEFYKSLIKVMNQYLDK